jgi:hypothetical protein
MMEAIHPSETSALTRTTWLNIPEDGILHSNRRENLKSEQIAHSQIKYTKRQIYTTPQDASL